jgi:hypothetical protein
MRQWVVVVGFFIIVLIVITGCTSPQSGNPPASNNQKSTMGVTTIKTTFASSYTSPVKCEISAPDPVQFQKFLPDVPGWTREYGKTIKKEYNYHYISMPGNYAWIKEVYQQNPEDPMHTTRVIVEFFEYNPCNNQSSDVYADLNQIFESKDDIQGLITTRIDNFHGYPAVKRMRFNATDFIQQEYVYIGINNRLRVDIATTGSGYSESEAGVNIEKFSNAIDFAGLAASI